MPLPSTIKPLSFRSISCIPAETFISDVSVFLGSEQQREDPLPGGGRGGLLHRAEGAGQRAQGTGRRAKGTGQELRFEGNVVYL